MIILPAGILWWPRAAGKPWAVTAILKERTRSFVFGVCSSCKVGRSPSRHSLSCGWHCMATCSFKLCFHSPLHISPLPCVRRQCAKRVVMRNLGLCSLNTCVCELSVNALGDKLNSSKHRLQALAPGCCWLCCQKEWMKALVSTILSGTVLKAGSRTKIRWMLAQLKTSSSGL